MTAKSQTNKRSNTIPGLIALFAAGLCLLLFIVVPQIKQFIRSHFPELTVTQSLLHQKYPDRQVSIADNQVQNGSDRSRTLTIDIDGQPALSRAERLALREPLCQALGVRAQVFEHITIRNMTSHNFLIFYSTFRTDPISFDCKQP